MDKKGVSFESIVYTCWCITQAHVCWCFRSFCCLTVTCFVVCVSPDRSQLVGSTPGLFGTGQRIYSAWVRVASLPGAVALEAAQGALHNRRRCRWQNSPRRCRLWAQALPCNLWGYCFNQGTDKMAFCAGRICLRNLGGSSCFYKDIWLN